MEMLEKEAVKKKCPFGMSMPNEEKVPDILKPTLRGSKCFGSLCMAWKATEEKAKCEECQAKGKIFTLKKKKHPKDRDEHNVKPCKKCNGTGFVETGKGYCTLIDKKLEESNG